MVTEDSGFAERPDFIQMVTFCLCHTPRWLHAWKYFSWSYA